MTNGQLFIKENPTVEIKINGSCVWIYFDGVNHYTMPTLWWEQEISLFNKIRAEIEEIETYDGLYVDRAYVLQILDKYKSESKPQESEDENDGR